jgi:5-aminolevulinate synthase
VVTIRSLAPQFNFTTSLPPAIMAGADITIQYQAKQSRDRILQQLHVRTVKSALKELDVPVTPNPSHIIPLLGGDAEMVKRASESFSRSPGSPCRRPTSLPSLAAKKVCVLPRLLVT